MPAGLYGAVNRELSRRFGGLLESRPSTVSVATTATRIVGRNFERADLSGKDLSGINFTCCNFRGADLSHSSLRGSLFVNADLSRACLHGCDATGADFSGADLTAAYCKAVDFGEARLWHTVLKRACCKNAKFFKADLTGADICGAEMLGALFDGARADGLRNIDRAIFRWFMPPGGGKPGYEPFPGALVLTESVIADWSWQENAGMYMSGLGYRPALDPERVAAVGDRA